MLISPKSNPFSIDSLLGIKETVAEPKDNENTTQNKTLCQTDPKGEGKIVTEGRADFERNQIDRISYSTLNLRGESLHTYGKSDYDSAQTFGFISERQREVLLQRQNEQLGHCRVRYWGAPRYHDPLSPWQYRYPSQGPLSRFIGKLLSKVWEDCHLFLLHVLVILSVPHFCSYYLLLYIKLLSTIICNLFSVFSLSPLSHAVICCTMHQCMYLRWLVSVYFSYLFLLYNYVGYSE